MPARLQRDADWLDAYINFLPCCARLRARHCMERGRLRRNEQKFRIPEPGSRILLGSVWFPVSNRPVLDDYVGPSRPSVWLLGSNQLVQYRSVRKHRIFRIDVVPPRAKKITERRRPGRRPRLARLLLPTLLSAIRTSSLRPDPRRSPTCLCWCLLVLSRHLRRPPGPGTCLSSSYLDLFARGLWVRG